MTQDRERREFDRTGEYIVANPPIIPHSPKDDDNTPTWVKIFGGTLLSIVFLTVITVGGWGFNYIQGLGQSINVISTDMVTKKEFNERQKALWDACKTIEPMRERNLLLEQQVNQLREENRLLTKDLQQLRERVAALEGPKKSP